MVSEILPVYTPFIPLCVSTLFTCLDSLLRLLLKRLVHMLNATVVSPRFNRCRMVPMPVFVSITRSVVARSRLRTARRLGTLVCCRLIDS